MPKWAIVFGALLVALGLIGYFGASSASASPPAGSGSGSVATAESDAAVPTKSAKTALIPAAFGFLLMLCGTLGLLENLRKHAMHVAAAVGLIGFLAAAGRLAMGLGKLLEGDVSRATWFLIGMALLCGVYVFMSIQSFRRARLSRSSE